MLPIQTKQNPADRELDQIIKAVDIDHIPDRFISIVVVVFNDGQEEHMTPQEVDRMFFAHAEYYGLSEDFLYRIFNIDHMRAVLDLTIVRAEIRNHSSAILANLPK